MSEEEYVTIYEKYWTEGGVRYKRISLDEGKTWERKEMVGVIQEEQRDERTVTKDR